MQDVRHWWRYLSVTLGRDPKKTEHIWRLPDGSEPKDLDGAFEQFLTKNDLLYDRNGQKRTLYSCRHSYATWQIVYRGVDHPTLAKNMGTSITMLEQHYSKLTPTLRAKQLTGRGIDVAAATLP